MGTPFEKFNLPGNREPSYRERAEFTDFDKWFNSYAEPINEGQTLLSKSNLLKKLCLKIHIQETSGHKLIRSLCQSHGLSPYIIESVSKRGNQLHRDYFDRDQAKILYDELIKYADLSRAIGPSRFPWVDK